MATSSITKNFVVSGKEQVEMFANAIEESYQESLYRTLLPDMRITHLRGSEEVKKFMAKRRNNNLTLSKLFKLYGLKLKVRMVSLSTDITDTPCITT